MAELAAILGVPVARLSALTIEARGDDPPVVTAEFEDTGVATALTYALRTQRELAPRRIAVPWGSVDQENGAAYRADGSLIRLSGRERGLLKALAQRPGQFVSNRELMVATWGAEYFDEDPSHLRVVLSRLRRRLGDSPPWRFITKSSQGCVLEVA